MGSERVGGFAVGDRVRIERDEELYPPRGSWASYRGRSATVAALNERDGELGVVFRELVPRDDGGGFGAEAWFLAHELTREGTCRAAQIAQEPLKDDRGASGPESPERGSGAT